MESWRHVWRDCLAPMLSKDELSALADALRRDDPALMQGNTTTPPPMACVQDWPCEGACLIGYAGWRGAGLVTVGEVNEYFARMCHEIDQRLGEPGGCRFLINWHDETPRDEMRAALLPEVEAALEASR